MTTRAVASALALLLTLTGCGVVRDVAGDQADASPRPSSAEELRAAADALDRGPYSFQFRTPTVIGAGAVDGQDGWLRTRIVGGDVGKDHLTFEVLSKSGQHLVRSDPLTDDQWTRLDLAKVHPGRRPAVTRFTDPARARELFAGIRDAEPTGDRGYRGTLDLTKVDDPGASRLLDREHLGAFTPQQLGAVPFEATVDAQRRLVGLHFTLPAAGGEPEQPAEISYSGLGYKPDLAAPFQGKIGPAPASVYELING